MKKDTKNRLTLKGFKLYTLISKTGRMCSVWLTPQNAEKARKAGKYLVQRSGNRGTDGRKELAAWLERWAK